MLDTVGPHFNALGALLEADHKGERYSEWPRPSWWKRILRIRRPKPNYDGTPIYWSRNIEIDNA
jgi:hypothetical protein